MPQKRIRIFAGPNGSGKSTMLRYIPDSLPLGVFINADEIEKKIDRDGINLHSYEIETTSEELYAFFEKSEFVKKKSKSEVLRNSFIVENNILKFIKKSIAPKYAAAMIADFLREKNLHTKNDFSFETVLSHKSKLDLIKRANEMDYHTYLYFICTDDPRVNVERVKTRVKEGGHPVPEDKIIERYFRTLNLLLDLLKICYKSYLFDNSDKFREIARVNRDKRIHFISESVPNWFEKYVIVKI